MPATPTTQTRDDLRKAVQPYAEAELCKRSFSDFVKRAWSHIERNPLVWNWHMDVVCEHLQAVSDGEITRLVICIPPGFGKSLLTSVFWPAWDWLRDPSIRGQYLSGNQDVQIRDAVRCRNLIQSRWYQRMKLSLGMDWDLAADQNAKEKYDTTEQGFRASGVIGGKITGDRADKQVLDDPYDIKEATRGTESRVRQRMREAVSDWDDVLVDRLNDERTDPRVLIMQRVHGADLAGVLTDRDYEVVSIRQEYKPAWPYQYEADPRDEAGELAFPERYPEEVVDERKRQDNYEATNNQDPQGSTGGIFHASWFYKNPDEKNPQLKKERTYTEGQLPDLETFDYIAQSWDFSQGAQEDDSSYVVGHIFGWRHATLWLFPVEHREQAQFNRMVEMVQSMSDSWPAASRKIVENKASGPQIIQRMQRKVGGFIEFEPQGRGSKDVRADIATEPLECGDFKVPDPLWCPWVRDWAAELVGFPGDFDDRIDTYSQFVLYTQQHGHDEPRKKQGGSGSRENVHYQPAPI